MVIDLRALEQVLPLAAASLTRRRSSPSAPLDPGAQWWRNFCAVAPAALVEYIQRVDEEFDAEPVRPVDADAWLNQRHPSAKNAIQALHHVVYGHIERCLPYVQGEIIKWAGQRLEYWFARERAAGKTATVLDRAVRDQAAMALLGWSGADSHAAWLEPERFVEQWRRQGTDDPVTLERANLHDAELWLLAQDDEGS